MTAIASNNEALALLPQPPKVNQKEFIKNAIRDYLQTLHDRGLHDKVLNSNTLRDSIIPACKKKIQLSYSIGPRLMLSFLQEVNEQYFENKFKFHYAANSFRSRGGRNSKSVDSTQYDKLHNIYTNLLESYTKLNDRTIKEREQYMNQINTLVNTVNMLTVECNGLRSTLNEIQEESASENPKKRKRGADQYSAMKPLQLPDFTQQTWAMQTNPCIRNICPSFGHVDEQLMIHVETANFSKKDSWIANIVNTRTNDLVQQKLDSTKLQQGMIALSLGRYSKPTDLMIHFSCNEKTTESKSFAVVKKEQNTDQDQDIAMRFLQFTSESGTFDNFLTSPKNGHNLGRDQVFQ